MQQPARWRDLLMTAAGISAGILALFPPTLSILESPEAHYFDDAYMFARYAQNMADGHGIAWNPNGPWTYGCTSLAHLILVFLIQLVIGFGQDFAAVITASVLGGVLSVAVLSFLAIQLTDGLRPPLRLLFILFTLPLALSPVFQIHLTTGMDTLLAAALCAVMVTLVILCHRADKLSPFMAAAMGAIAAGAFLVRPDLPLSLCAMGGLAVLLVGEVQDRWKRTAFFIGGFLITLGGLFSVLTLAFGSPLPLPFYVKRTDYYEDYVGVWNPIDLFYSFAVMVLPYAIAAVIFWRSNDWRYVLILVIPVVLHVLYYSTVLQIMGMEGRFYVPMFPVFVGAALYAAADCAHNGLPVMAKPGRIAGVIVLLALWPSATWKPAIDAWDEAHRELAIKSYQGSRIIWAEGPRSWWGAVTLMAEAAQELPEGTRLAASEHGRVGAAATQITIIDLAALHDPQFAKNGFDPDLLFERSPDIIWLPHTDYIGQRRAITSHREFEMKYDWYPGGGLYGIALEKDSEREIYRDILIRHELIPPD